MSDWINDTLDNVNSAIESSDIEYNQLESYEGQLEDLRNFVITPPSLFTEIELGNNQADQYLDVETTLNIYAVTSHMKGSTASSMYSLLVQIMQLFHSKDIGDETIFLSGFERLAIIPGFCAYRVAFKFDHKGG